MSESILVENLRKGSQEGFVAVYHYFYKTLNFFVLRYLKNAEQAEEILADVFMKVWTRRTDFESAESLRAFLYIAAKHASLNAIRDQKKDFLSIPVTEIQELLSEDSDVFTKMVHVELIQAIFMEAERLPERQKEVFKMTYQEDKTVDEIAEALAISPDAVYTNRSRAVSTLRHLLKAKNALLFTAFLYLLQR
ncbi:sigma-70 family RNA polymerase sigma factor [Sphingobacterium psychroaquaticum]|uniref:RNA polymerase sigma factor n=1 Tax=Sphingobacterium psychroaquaticum TaxID=561061 RepID=UPI00106A5C58|nr:sigma-70 family RNA polymerase sigma factor [Sphingobacterium psychroaquaticum]QBQ42093.1 sigma-70 family RNA polymerase sigma factor [Sphingobacterium psychroaquaticum]